MKHLTPLMRAETGERHRDRPAIITDRDALGDAKLGASDTLAQLYSKQSATHTRSCGRIDELGAQQYYI